MKDRARSGFALMVVIAVVLGVLIGTRNVGSPVADTQAQLTTDDQARPVAAGGTGTSKGETPAGTAASSTPADELGARSTSGGAATQDQIPEATGEDFFAEYRLERTRTRSKNIEMLQQIVADENTSEEARAAASSELVDLSKRTEAEAEAEALIRARGYKDALVFVRGDACDVVVSGPELTRADAEQIGDIVARCLGVDLANITIIERTD